MATIRLTEEASADLDAILDDFDRRSPAALARFTSEFRRKSLTLGQFPESGRPRPEFGAGLRSTLVRPYVVFYRFDPGADVVQVVRILHASSDLKTIMDQEGG